MRAFVPASSNSTNRASQTAAANPFGVVSAVALAATLALSLALPASRPLWLPQLGVGLAGAIWLGGRFVILIAVTLLVGGAVQSTFVTSAVPFGPLVNSSLIALSIALGWALYSHAAGGAPELDDPRSATLFLLLVPGVAAAATAFLEILLTGKTLKASGLDILRLFGESWIAHMLGFLVVAPLLLVNLTPSLQKRGLLPRPVSPALLKPDWTWGEAIELTGLAFGNGILALIQVHLHLRVGDAAWPLWGISLLLVVWSSIRQGSRGGTVTAFAGSAAMLVWGDLLGVVPDELNPLQGNLLGQCSVALLVGSSVAWIRATEARYRQVVGHIPLVLTSVRLRRGVSVLPDGVPHRVSSMSRPDLKVATSFIETAELILVSRASKDVLGVAAEDLVGPYSLWLDVVHPEDRDLVIASISQLALQRQMISLEYRVTPRNDSGNAAALRWVRDTLNPHYSSEGLLDGWDGVVEEITERRHLQQENRRIAGMLQALVANMPTGVFFVQGPAGQPVLVNARARHLLGQREDASAGLAHLSQVYRLHRPDGTPYPVDDLPVAKALRYGQTCTANDIVVHRPDGRRMPLFTWAAPIDLGVLGRPEGAVWVLEDLSALQQAETARRESEARLRAVFETLAEGVIVQDKSGVVIEGNPTAASILGVPLEQLAGRTWLGPEIGCLQENGLPCAPEQHPDRLALQIKRPVRDAILGLPRPDGELRWLLVNSMPLPVGTAFLPNTRGAQLVTTFTNITAERLTRRSSATARAPQEMDRVHVADHPNGK
jgi:PAS domain S-box-containing protein